MEFKDAFKLMQEGKWVRRPVFRGYWFIDPESGIFSIKLSSGKVIQYGKLDITVKNIMENDWEEVDKEKEMAFEKAHPFVSHVPHSNPTTAAESVTKKDTSFVEKPAVKETAPASTPEPVAADAPVESPAEDKPSAETTEDSQSH